MMRLLCAAAWLVCLLTAPVAAPLPLAHGVGVHEWLNWSPLAKDGSYRWPPYRSMNEWRAGGRPLSDWPRGNEFERIRSVGFDFVRLSVDPGPLLASKGAKRQEALAVLADKVRRVTSAGLKVVFDLHSVNQVPAYSIALVNSGADSDGIALYRRMVVSVAKMLVTIGTDKVALEPYNEPAYYPCDASGTDDWQRIMSGTVADIRAVSSNLTIIVTGACGGSIDGLINLKPDFDDPNLYYNFHMYDPHSFTHQRADDAKNFMSGLPWPAEAGTYEGVIENLKSHMRAAGLTEEQQARNLAQVKGPIRQYFKEDWGLPQMQARIGQATAWAAVNNIPVNRLFMGEFGVILMSDDGRMGAFNDDRLAYLTALRKEAERHHIPWSIWEYSNPYGMTVILPKGLAVPDMGLLKALGLK
jgi:hypothetical protein